MAGHFPEKAVHGGKVQELRRVFGHDFLDVSASMNPFVPQVSADFSCADLSVYPDDSYAELKSALHGSSRGILRKSACATDPQN